MCCAPGLISEQIFPRPLPPTYFSILARSTCAYNTPVCSLILSTPLLRLHSPMNIKRAARLLSDFKRSSFFSLFFLFQAAYVYLCSSLKTLGNLAGALCCHEPQQHVEKQLLADVRTAPYQPMMNRMEKRVLSCFSDSYQHRSICNSTRINTELHFSTLSDPATLSVMTRKALHNTTLASVVPFTELSTFSTPFSIGFDGM